MLFRSAGTVSSDPQAKASRVYSVDELLAYRDTWTGVEPMNIDEVLQRANAPPEPVAALQQTAGGFRARREEELSDGDRLVRQVQGSLNKLTEENFEVLVPPLLQPKLFDEGVVPEVVRRIFEKALDEPLYAELYAKMCVSLAKYEHEFLGEGGQPQSKGRMRTSIIERSQMIFEAQASELADMEERSVALRKRKVANINFLGCLYMNELLHNRVLSQIFRSVLFQTTGLPEEMDIEVVVHLLNRVGDKLDKLDDMREHFNHVFSRLQELQSKYSNRVRFQIMNLVELRSKKWVRPVADDTVTDKTPSPSPVPQSGSPEGQVGTPTVPGARKVNYVELRPALPPKPDDPEIEEKAASLLSNSDSTGCDVPVPEKIRAVATLLRNQTAPVNRMFAIYVVATKACLKTDQIHLEQVAEMLVHKAWFSAEVRAGLSWVATAAVVNAVTDDCPKFFERLAFICVRLLADKAGFRALVVDFLGSTATQLETIFVDEPDADGSEWETSYLRVWDCFLRAAKAQRDSSDVVPPASELLDVLGDLKGGRFVSAVLPDLIESFLSTGLGSEADVVSWKGKVSKKSDLAHVVSAIELLGF